MSLCTSSPFSSDANDCWAVAGLIAARYGRLALSHAAGRKMAAVENGDAEIAAIWDNVVVALRATK
jgi:hypothetical protein